MLFGNQSISSLQGPSGGYCGLTVLLSLGQNIPTHEPSGQEAGQREGTFPKHPLYAKQPAGPFQM